MKEQDLFTDKKEVVRAMEDLLAMYDGMFDNNLDKMADLQEQITNLKTRNTMISKRMKEIAEVIRGLKGETKWI